MSVQKHFFQTLAKRRYVLHFYGARSLAWKKDRTSQHQPSLTLYNVHPTDHSLTRHVHQSHYCTSVHLCSPRIQAQHPLLPAHHPRGPVTAQPRNMVTRSVIMVKVMATPTARMWVDGNSETRRRKVHWNRDAGK